MAYRDRVGFFGCYRIDGLVRFGVQRDPAVPLRHYNYPAATTVKCKCGEVHEVAIAWRELNKGEEPDIDVWVEPKADPTKSTGPQRGATRNYGGKKGQRKLQQAGR